MSTFYCPRPLARTDEVWRLKKQTVPIWRHTNWWQNTRLYATRTPFARSTGNSKPVHTRSESSEVSLTHCRQNTSLLTQLWQCWQISIISYCHRLKRVSACLSVCQRHEWFNLALDPLNLSSWNLVFLGTRGCCIPTVNRQHNYNNAKEYWSERFALWSKGRGGVIKFPVFTEGIFFFFFFIILILCKVNSGPICRVQMVSNPDFHASDLEFKSRWNLHFFSSKIAAEVPFLY